MNNAVRPIPLVEVSASGEDGGDLACRGDHNPERAAVTDNSRLGEAGELGQLTTAYRLTKIIRGGRPSGSQHEGCIEASDVEAFQNG